MAFHDYRAREQVPDAPDQRPEMTPLGLDLVPPVLCHSFGIPMHDAYYMAGPSMYGYGYGMPSGNPHNPGYQAQYMSEHAQMQHAAGYGCMPSDYSGFSQARMFPYHGHHSVFAQMPQVPYPPHEMYNAHFRRPDSGQLQQDIGVPANLPAQGYEQPQNHQKQQRPQSDGRGVKRSADQANSLPSDHGTANSGQAHLVAVALKRTRLVWTPELHQRFEEAVTLAGGIEVAVPKTVLEYMNVDGLTRDNVASHLQKHRMHLKKIKADGKQAPRAQVKSYSQADAACTQSARTTSMLQEQRAQPSSPVAGECEATTIPVRAAGEAGAKSHANSTFTTEKDDGSGRGQGESSGDGTSGSGNSTSRHVAVVTPHSGSRGRSGDATGAVGYSNGASTDAGGRSSQTHNPQRSCHNHSGGNSNQIGHGRGRGSQTLETTPVDESNGTCGQSGCDQLHDA